MFRQAEATRGDAPVLSTTAARRAGMALGAQSGDVRRMAIGQALRLAAVGVMVGLIAELAAANALASLLFGVSVHDRATCIGVCILLTAVAVVASYEPARRATKVDPLNALRMS